jgi:ABC-type multidrug transport system permease subunit
LAAVLSDCDPFTYAVHGFRTLLLKNVGISAISTDIFALVLTSAVVLTGATLLFRRTL